MTPIWSETPRILIEKPQEFIYSDAFDANRNLNALVRFAIYWALLSFIITRNSVVFVLLALALFLMRRNTVKSESIILDNVDASSSSFCQSPSADNPMSNPTPNDWGNGHPKLPACPNQLVEDEINHALDSQPITGPLHELGGGQDANTKLARRSFYSVPVSGVPDTKTAFVHGLFGSNIGRSYS